MLRKKASANKKTMIALNDLVSLAPELTYFRLFTESIPDYSKLDAVRASVKHEIIAVPSNGKCCNVDTGVCTGGSKARLATSAAEDRARRTANVLGIIACHSFQNKIFALRQ